jgi:hypothetical protein
MSYFDSLYINNYSVISLLLLNANGSLSSRSAKALLVHGTAGGLENAKERNKERNKDLRTFG